MTDNSSGDRTCKRCSVNRVNRLVTAYEAAHNGNGKSLGGLKSLVSLAVGRNYREAQKLLVGGLADKELRALCWNASSLLTDDEVDLHLG